MAEQERRLELVTDFGQLRTGMLVVGKPCHCGGEHELLLLSPDPNPPPRFGRAYTVARKPPCALLRQMYYVCEVDVRRARVYRVVDGLDLQKDADQQLLEAMEETLKREAAAGLAAVSKVRLR